MPVQVHGVVDEFQLSSEFVTSVDDLNASNGGVSGCEEDSRRVKRKKKNERSV